MANMRYKNNEMPKARPSDKLIERLRAACLSRSVSGIKQFATSFQIFDDNRDRRLDKVELLKAFNDYRVQYTNDEIDDLFQQFDTNKSGSLDFDEFLISLRVNSTS
jgi:Ca2+-binding EF-hand superfamily protein